MFGIKSTSAKRLDVAIKLATAEIARIATANANDPRVVEARTLLGNAEEAHAAGRVEQGWQCLKAAQRPLWHFADLSALEAEARALLATAKDAGVGMTPWRAKAIVDSLEPQFAAGVNRQEAVMRPLVIGARRLLDDYLDNNYIRLSALRRRLGWLSFASAVALALWAIFPPLDMRAPTPPATALGKQLVKTPELFWASVMLAGAIGSLISTFTSAVSAIGARSKIPEEINAVTITLSRLLLAALSATALVLFVVSGLHTVVQASYELVLSLALIAGFSDRLLMAALEKTK
ncbi:MAG: hypothetical protein FJX20_20340 [Alphaproteobacteria bacterium]|nr:hypothetical protein [Alphaproteobacteria bacterium]